MLAGHRHGHLFVAGGKADQGKFCAQFGHIALLSASVGMMLIRPEGTERQTGGWRI